MVENNIHEIHEKLVNQNFGPFLFHIFSKQHRDITKWKFGRVILAWKKKPFIPAFLLPNG